MRMRRREWPSEAFQMAPMIDMVFLLLVFFMCVSTLAIAEKAHPVALPESAQSEVPEDLSNRLTITVAADGSVYAGSVPIDRERLAARLKAALQGRPDLKVHVRADRGVPYGRIRRILQTCADAGVWEIVYATYQES